MRRTDRSVSLYETPGKPTYSVFSVALLAAMCTANATAAQDVPVSLADSILSESHALEARMSPEQRAFHLGFLAQAAAAVAHPDTLDWVREGLKLSQHLPPSWDRLALQRNLLLAANSVDSSYSLEQLPLLEPPVPLPGGSIPEDVRANCAIPIFQTFWLQIPPRKRDAALEQIRDVSQSLGDTGEFPFLALIPVIKDRVKSGSPDGDSLFLTAADYIPARQDIQSVDRDVAAFLVALDGSVSDTLLKWALRLAVDRLEESARVAGNKKRSVVLASDHVNGNRIHAFSSTGELALATLMPLVSRLDPQLAHEIRDKFPNISLDGSPNASNMMTADSGAAQGQLTQQILDRAKLDSLSTMQPDEAFAAANSINSSSLQAVAFQSLIASSPAGSRADNMLATISTSLDKTDDVGKRIELVTSLIEAQAPRHTAKEIEPLVRSTLLAGSDAWKHDTDSHPANMTFASSLYDSLSALVKSYSQIEPYWMRDQVRLLDSEQSSYLMLSVAEGAKVFESKP